MLSLVLVVETVVFSLLLVVETVMFSILLVVETVLFSLVLVDETVVLRVVGMEVFTENGTEMAKPALKPKLQELKS